MEKATTAATGDQSLETGSSGKPSGPTGRQNASARSDPADSAKPKKKPRRRRTAGRLFKFDRELGYRFVAGADEAGRGSLAGPLVAAAVMFDYTRLTLSERRAMSRLDDSKVRDEQGREELYPLIMGAATRVGVATRCVGGIDDRGLHVTNLQALRDSLRMVACDTCVCLVDGFKVPDFGREQRAVIDGDARSAAIAAASVIAKVTRDRYMKRLADRHPEWHFDSNVGYSTPDHRAAIAERGITAHHRRSFQSIAYQQLAIEA